MARVYHEREVRLLNEFIAKRFPDREVVFNTRVGDISDAEKASAGPDTFMLNTFRSRLPRADAIVFDGPVVWIVEAKLEAEQRGAAQLTTYRMLLSQTPGFAERLKGKVVKTLLVIARDSKILRDLCAELDHSFEVFQPEWAVDYMAKRGVVKLSWK